MQPLRDREAPTRIASDHADERDVASDGGAPRALFVSDVRLYREGLVWQLAKTGRVDVLATADSADSALTTTVALAPDVVIIDRAMSDAFAIARAVGEQSSAKVVAFAIADVDYAVIDCADAGLAGYITRDGTVDELAETVERAVRGEAAPSRRDVRVSLLDDARVELHS